MLASVTLISTTEALDGKLEDLEAGLAFTAERLEELGKSLDSSNEKIDQALQSVATTSAALDEVKKVVHTEFEFMKDTMNKAVMGLVERLEKLEQRAKTDDEERQKSMFDASHAPSSTCSQFRLLEEHARGSRNQGDDRKIFQSRSPAVRPENLNKLDDAPVFPMNIEEWSAGAEVKRVPVNLSIADRMKIWQRKLSQRKIISVGDPAFPTAKEDFFRLHAKFPLPDELEAELSLLSFGDAATDIVNAVCRKNPNKSAAELWESFEQKLFNETQRRSQNTSFLNFKLDERTETVAKLGEIVQLLGSSLAISKDMIQATFIQGLPKGLQVFAYTNRGSFDELVSAIDHISTTQRRPENVRETREEAGAGPSATPGSSDQSWRASSSPVPARHADKEKNNRFPDMICHRCREKGHVSWQRHLCKKYLDDLAKRNAEQGAASSNREEKDAPPHSNDQKKRKGTALKRDRPRESCPQRCKCRDRREDNFYPRKGLPMC